MQTFDRNGDMHIDYITGSSWVNRHSVSTTDHQDSRSGERQIMDGRNGHSHDRLNITSSEQPSENSPLLR